MVKINGNYEDVAGKNLENYIVSKGYDKNCIAVERNGEIVPKNDYCKITICDNDSIEVVSFVGGG